MSCDIIHQLPDSVANQIAAGEVIQRPASVIKELVENAVDAKATRIDITLKDAGRTLIQISDNGIGMSPTDARMSFARHSTSKISSADDLFSLHTMGFRGEALASIAAIAQVELRTQREEDSIGTLINLIGNDCRQEPLMYGKGTCFKIKNLFYNVPARRKFLKSNQVELSNILREFERLSLINEDKDFSISHNGNIIHALAAGSFKQRIISLFGKSLENQIIPVNVDTSIIKIEGFISMPEHCRKRNYLQYLFVNGRYMRHPYFHKAIISCFDKLIPQDHQPNYFIKFTVDPQTIDVNIHPTKTEIKFENEQIIWPIVSAAIKEAIGKFSTAPSIDFNREDAIDIPVFTKDTEVVNPQEFTSGSPYNPFNISSGKSSANTKWSPDKRSDYSKGQLDNWESLYDSFLTNKNVIDKDVDADLNNETETTVKQSIPENYTEREAVLFDSIQTTSSDFLQVKGKYIISQVKSGIMIIDQHRAHLMVIYHNLIHQQENNGCVVSQRILFPETIEVSAAQSNMLLSIQDELQKSGFEITSLGNNSWAIHSVPSDLNNINCKDVIMNIIDSVSENIVHSGFNISNEIIYRIAQRSAIPYGTVLTQEEMDSLIGQLLSIPTPNYTPKGKVIIKIISLEQLSKLFL